ncbi:hypothetical protein SFRURICE_007881, partial [Spodoptera frugiperda]
SLTANRKLLKANPPITSVTGDHQGVQCVKQLVGTFERQSKYNNNYNVCLSVSPPVKLFARSKV